MARFAQDPIEGLAVALRALHFHGVIRLHNDFLKEMTTLETSKLKDGHKRHSKNTHFHDNDVKL
jgi:hypothetical protein